MKRFLRNDASTRPAPLRKVLASQGIFVVQPSHLWKQINDTKLENNDIKSSYAQEKYVLGYQINDFLRIK